MGTKEKKKESLMDRLRKKKEELKRQSQGGSYFTIKEGKIRMRPVPVKKEQDWGMEVVFFWLGPKLGGIISPATFNEKCPFMRAHTKAASSKSQDDRDLAKILKPGKKFMVGHYKYKDIAGKEPDLQMGVKPLILTSGQYQNLLDLYLDEDNGDFTDPDEGYDIKYERTGKGLTDTKYTLLAGKPSKCYKKFRGPYDIEAMVRECILPYDELKQKLNEFLNNPQEEPDEEERPRKKKKKSRDL